MPHTSTVDEMLSADRAEWDALVALLDAQPEAVLHGEGVPEWTSRDVYNHLGRWITRSTDELEAHLHGRTLPKLEGTDDEINARWQAEDSGLSLAEAKSRAQAAFDRRAQAIASVPAERWHDEALVEIAHADDQQHFRGHRNAIQLDAVGE